MIERLKSRLQELENTERDCVSRVEVAVRNLDFCRGAINEVRLVLSSLALEAELEAPPATQHEAPEGAVV